MLALGVIAGFAFVGVRSWEGARQMAGATLAAEANDIRSILYNEYALIRFSWPADWRRQFSASFLGLMFILGDRLKVDPRDATKIWQTGLTVSPWDSTVLLSRAQYLLTYGPYSELPPVVERLTKVAGQTPHAWYAAAITALIFERPEEAKAAVAKGLALKRRPADRHVYALLEHLKEAIP